MKTYNGNFLKNIVGVRAYPHCMCKHTHTHTHTHNVKTYTLKLKVVSLKVNLFRPFHSLNSNSTAPTTNTCQNLNNIWSAHNFLSEINKAHVI